MTDSKYFQQCMGIDLLLLLLMFLFWVLFVQL